VIELLAITDDPAPLRPPLRLVAAGRVSVVVAPAPAHEGGADAPAEPGADAEALWQRESLLEELMRERALLPVRYGTRVEDEAAAAAAVAPRAGELAAALDRVRGAVEVSVRAVARHDGASGGAAANGGDDSAVRAVDARLAALAREHARHEGPELLRAAYLVDRAEVDGFVAAVRALQHEHAGLSILCTGPWPPYSFTEGP
jgi:hypothetical protein